MGCGPSAALASGPDADPQGDVEHSLLSGTLDEASLARLQRQPMLSLYVASTPADTRAERGHFESHVWPRLREVCEARGLGFEVVDLRGVLIDCSKRDCDGAHVSLADLCLSEAARCCELSADGAAAFLLFSGDRYRGGPLLPRRVPAAELEALLARIPAEAPVRALIKSWYRLDSNSSPEPQAVLRGMEEMAAEAGALGNSFAAAEGLMAEALRAAAPRAGLAPDRMDEWTLSLTHKVGGCLRGCLYSLHIEIAEWPVPLHCAPSLSLLPSRLRLSSWLYKAHNRSLEHGQPREREGEKLRYI